MCMEEKEKVDYFACGFAYGAACNYGFYSGPPLCSRICEVQVPVFCDVNQWHEIHTKDPLWNQLPPEFCEIIALKLFYWETKYQCDYCDQIFDQQVQICSSCFKN